MFPVCEQRQVRLSVWFMVKKKQQNTCEEEAADIVFMIKSRVEHVSESKINFTKAFYSYSCKSTRK